MASLNPSRTATVGRTTQALSRDRVHPTLRLAPAPPSGQMVKRAADQAAHGRMIATDLYPDMSPSRAGGGSQTCNTRRMATGQFTQLLPPGLEPHPSAEDLMLQLEAAGWVPRKLINGRGIRFHRDQERGRQIVVDLLYPPNEPKLEFYRTHTGLDLVLKEAEKGS